MAGRKRLPDHLRRDKHYIKIYFTDSEFEMLQSAKNRLSNHSPALSVQDVFRKIVLNIDDLSLLAFLDLPRDDPIKIQLLNSILFKK